MYNTNINKKKVIEYHLKEYEKFYKEYNTYELIKNKTIDEQFDIIKDIWNKYHVLYLNLGDGWMDFEFNPNIGYAINIDKKNIGYSNHFIDKNGYQYKLDSNYLNEIYNNEYYISDNEDDNLIDYASDNDDDSDNKYYIDSP